MKAQWMKTQGRHQTWLGYAFSFVLVLFVSGCGGGGNTPVESVSLCGTPTSTELVHADTGNIVAVRVNQTAVLNGCASSTTLLDPLAYAWSFSSKPAASTAQLQNATSVSPSFIADAAGTYMVQLVVSAGGVSSPRAVAAVEVTIDGNYTGDKRVHTSYPSQCAECHDGRLAAGDGPIAPVLAKSGNHPATSNLCQACHTTFGFNLIRYVDHLEVFGNCSSCHNGVVAIGKSEFHVQTTVECDNCHDTTSFVALGLDGKFDHTGITSGCAQCHNGITAIGKHAAHPVTNSDCSNCHTIATFLNAYPDHGGPDVVGKRCDSCHNASGGGFGATDQPVGHPVMGTTDCGTCHSTRLFSMGGVFNHRVDPTDVPCSTCHNANNSIGARGKTPTHPDTTSECGVCHGIGGGSFANAIYDHTGITNNCGNSGCHDITSVTGAYAAGNTHIPSNGNDCENCHTPGTFTTGFYDHSGVVNGCTSCHNGVITAGKSANHIPTTPDDQDCAVCHVIKFDNFTGAVFNHTGITNNCASCHDGNISPGKSTNHMPTTRDCSDCHVIKFDDFTGGSFDHLDPVVTNICATCHDGVIALGKKVNHIPAQTECNQCHIDTSIGGFVSSIFLSDVHPGLATGCEGCHTSRFFPSSTTAIKAASHLPTSQDCHVCHTNVAFTPSIFDHSGISGNCVSCHDGSANNVAVGARGKTSVASGHPDTTEDCGVCHGLAGGSFANGVFDHTGRVDNCNECHADGATGASTKKNPGHVPTTEDCSVCHVPGTFTTAVFSHTGIVDNCASCHDGSVATATVKSTNHIPTTEDCSVCHNTTAFAGARFDHTGVVDNCASCHDGSTAIGKDGNHVPTSNDCSVCHQTTGFIPATFDHVGIVDNCVSCHDGGFAQGKKVGHVQTIEDCGVCHRVPANGTGFIPAIVEHSALPSTTRCDSCHVDGSATLVGKDDKTNPAHLVTSLDCRSCHTTATFVGGTWTHDSSSAGVCDQCHNGTDATGKSGTHFSTDFQCDVCHSTNGWAPTIFSHDPGGNYPGDHRRDPGCSGCHGSIVTTPFVYPSAQYAPFCAACHEGDFTSKSDHNGGRSGTVAQNKDCSGGGGGCHRVGASGF
jgi:hypothetical protein